MKHFKQILEFSAAQIDFFSNLKLENFIAINIKVEDIALYVDNFALFVLDEADRVELQEFYDVLCEGANALFPALVEEETAEPVNQ
jgi:hypothetical protein